MAMRNSELLFVDVETTGHDPSGRRDALVEVAVALVDLSTMNVVRKFESLIRPEPGAFQTRLTDKGWVWNLGEFHQKGQHFSGVNWQEARPLEEVLSVLGQTFLPNATLAGQNPEFDVAHLERDFATCGIHFPPIDYHRVDLVSPSVFLLLNKKTERLSLSHTLPWALELLGLPARVQQHRAMADVLDEIDVFRAFARVFRFGLAVGAQTTSER